MSDRQQKVQWLRENLPYYCANYIKIRSKEGGKPQPFILNRAQLTLHAFLEEQLKTNNMVRACVIKGRQQGVSTYTAARYLHRATLNPGTAVFILAHISDSTEYLFRMVKRMYENLPEPLQPSIAASNRKELRFGAIDSEYSLGTAGSANIGRGTTPRLLHCSEAAFYDNTDELTTGLFQGVPNGNQSEIILESTANGVGNLFYNLCMKGIEADSLSEYKTIFLPWYWQDEYRRTPPPNFKPSEEEHHLMEVYGLDLSQIYWRKMKLEGEYENKIWKFNQEYPMNIHEAFVSSGTQLVPPHRIQEAVKRNLEPDTIAPKILGVDPARQGDRTALVLRQGRKILKIITYTDMNEMRLAGIIAKMIDDEDLDMVFLDVAHGYGTRDRLHELGYGSKVHAVHFGESAIQKDIYRNKRAEMYGLMRDWFEEGADIPDHDGLLKDLSFIPDFKISGSRGLLQLPSKDEIKEENGGLSPDVSDAAALTFAYPVRARSLRGSQYRRTDIDVTRARSPFKSRRLSQSFVNGSSGPSEFYVR